MKYKFSQVTKKSVSLLLAILMMFSMLTIGITTTSAAITAVYLSSSRNWDNWLPFTNTADGTIAYYNITSDYNWNYKLSTSNSSHRFSELSIDNDKGDLTVSGNLDNVISVNANSSFYYCVELATGKVYASTTEPTGGGTTPTPITYTVNAGTTDHGNITLDSTSPAVAGSTFNFTVSANTGFQINTVTVTKDGTSEDVEVSGSDGSYSFTMPAANVTINATFSESTISPKYYLIGDLSVETGGKKWDVDNNSTPVKELTSTPGVFYYDIPQTSDTKYFRITDGTTVYCGQNETGNTQITALNTYYDTTAYNNDNKAIMYNFDNNSRYTLFINQNGTTPSVMIVKRYAVNIGTYDNGQIALVSSSPAGYGTPVEFKVKANDGFNIDSVTLSDGTTVTAGTTDAEGYTHYTFDMPNNEVTISAEFTSTATETTATETTTPTPSYFYSYYNGSSNQYVPMRYDSAKGWYYVNIHSGIVRIEGEQESYYKFKITNNNSTNPDSASQTGECANYRIYENTNNGANLSNYLTLSSSLNSLITVTFDGGEFKNFQFPTSSYSIGDSNSTNQLVLTYIPDNTGLLGQIKLWTKTDYDGQSSTDPTTPTSLTLSQTTANLGVGETVTLTATHKADCATNAVTFSTDNSAVATVTNAGVVTAVGKGTATITATCTGCGTATCEVTVSTIPFAVADRIYAYAGSTTDNIQSDAWVCSEDASASKINTHTDKGKVQPKLGSTDAANLRIFLPTTVGNSVLLYNSFSYAVTINGVEIQPNTYESVPFESDTSYNFTVNGSNKSLKLYKSAADGALYLNNTEAPYAGVSSDGTVAMYNHLFSASDKDASEMASGNRGAVAYSDEKGTTISNVTVKKVKGRGNSTWRDANKKSFNVNFNENLGGKINKDFKGKKYSLLANFKDPSLSRNKILYQLAKDMGVKYVPATATVDVYMNGLYLGSYLMTQKVEVGSKDVVSDISDTLLEKLYKDTDGTVPDTAADSIEENGFSFLMELDSNAGADDFFTKVTESGFEQTITIKEPEYQDTGRVATAAKTFVENKYKELINALNDTTKTYAQLNAIVDVDSLVKYLLINEIAKNYDIGVSSTYFVYNYTAKKFYASPIWDMDVSTGNCKSTIENYQSYEGNWTDNLNDGTGNNFMKRVFANPVIQSAARKLWTADYYTTLTSAINKVHKSSTDVLGSINNNYAKWNYPYGFQGGFKDNVQARTELKVAAYTNGNYTEASTNTPYATTAKGQIDYIKDWLTSRVAWMTNKYNKYYIVGTAVSDWNSPQPMENSSGINKFTRNDLPAGTYQFKICSDGGGGDNKEGDSQAYRDWTATSISYSKDLKLVSTTGKITNLGIGINDNNKNITFTTSETMTVYFTYNQKTNTVTLSDTTTTNTDPIVTLEGSTVANEDRVSGTAVTLTATVKPAVVDDVVVAGDYTVTLYRGIDVVKSETVKFADTDTADTTKTATFSTALTGSNDSYTVKVEKDTYSATSDAVSYVQTGQKNNKIYFDPSSDSNWKAAIDENSTVTVTVGGKTFKMIIDPENVHALTKGVFRAMVDDETLTAMQNNTVTFTLDGSTSATAISTSDNESDITKAQDGYIYTYDTKNGSKWCQYNVPVVPKYPGGCNNYQEFEAYLKDQADPASTKKKDNIVYFDNSASEWYNVFIYDWNTYSDGKDHKNAVMLEKLPYANIWYYDFGESMPTNKFLFKDRSNNAYGTNYQQTVDLVGKLNGTSGEYVLNGNGEKDYLNFENTISTPNPIFVTANFYNCTQQGENEIDLDKKLKYRAFNTEWKEFYTVATSAVRTKAIDVYFDMHESTNIDNIQLYHSTKDEDKDGNPDFEYTFASKFTRLNRLPGSNIYYASIQLPYTTADGITTAFNFDKFVVNYSDSTTAKSYNMSAAVQPKKNCITTGEVWYEFDLKGHSNTISADTSTVSSSSSAKKLSSGKSRISSGANVSILPSGLKITNATIFFEKPDNWTNPRMVIGNNAYGLLIEPTINGNICTFKVTYDKGDYNGFYFCDYSGNTTTYNGDYWYWMTAPETAHTTHRVENNITGATYRLASGSDGPLVTSGDYNPITTIYVPKALTVGGSGNSASKFYVWYDYDGRTEYPNGVWNDCAISKGILININGTEFYRFDFYCPAETFNFKLANGNSGETSGMTNFASGRAYRITNDDIGTGGTATYEVYRDTTTFYIPTDLQFAETPVTNAYAWDTNQDTKAYFFGNWAGGKLDDLCKTKQTINGKEYWVLSIPSYGVDGDVGLVLNTGSSNTRQTTDMSFTPGGTYTINGGNITEKEGDKYKITNSDTTPVTFNVDIADNLALDLYNAKTSKLDATTQGFTNVANVTWTTENGYVATVDSSGNVTAVGTGTTAITAKYIESGIIRTDYTLVTVTDSTPADAIRSFKVNGNSTATITLSGDPATATATLAIDITNPSKTVSYSIKKDSAEVTDESVAKVSADGTIFTATQAGTYVVTATINGTDITAEVTITVNQGTTTVTDHCGILGYNHVTATFESTTGGTIVAANTGVTLKGGYYTDEANTNGLSSYLTGYKTNNGDVITVIYALVTEKTGASTTINSKTSKADGNSDYKFDDWTKNETMFSSTTELSDSTVNSTSTVNYVANWSVEKKVDYTLIYNYEEYNKSTDKGVEYDESAGMVNATPYTVKVKINKSIVDSISTNADSKKAILDLYHKYAPTISSDYFDYSFNNLEFANLTIDQENNSVSGMAEITKTKTYSVTLKDVGGTPVVNKEDFGVRTSYYYQNIVTLTNSSVEKGKTTVWKNADTDVIIGYGNTYKFRITKNITISYEVVESTSLENRTFVNAPTYEFYTDSKNQQRVRFNFLVENYPTDISKVSGYGVLYFFTDKDGKPLDSTIAEDKDSISKDVLESAALGASTGIMKTDFTTLAEKNNNRKYIFAPTLSYTSANIDRYLRVYSYFITKGTDKDGKEIDVAIVSEPTSCILGSIREAIT